MAHPQQRPMPRGQGLPLSPVFRVDKTEGRATGYGHRAFYFSRAIHNPTP